MLNITDNYGRSFGTLRVSLTNNCNFGCIYCINNDESKNNFRPVYSLNYTELADLVISLNKTLELKSIRLTGGEPTLYRDLIPFIKLLSENGVENIKMTTNGFLLKQKAGEMASAGIKEINVSLDAIDPDIFAMITNRNLLQQVLEGIDAALNIGISVKLNAVIMKGINENQVLPLLEYAISKDIKLRFLELMRMGHLYSKDFIRHFFSMQEILDSVKSKYPVGPSYREKSATAKYWTLWGENRDEFEFGIIANESEPFCFDCNRLRLDSYGNIYGCLSENKREYIADIMGNKKLLREKLLITLSHKQQLKFKGSSMKMIEVGG